MENQTTHQAPPLSLPPLYKRDSKDKLRIWTVEVSGPTFTTRAGLIDGTLTSNTTTCHPKNQGRANETTAEQQAVLEAKAKWKKKRDRELYTETRPPRNQNLAKSTNVYIAPQLALDLNSVPHRVDWSMPLRTQPKLNGVRCIAQCVRNEVLLTSRKGKVYRNFAIENDIKRAYMVMNKSVILDGELYIHGVELGDVTKQVARPESTQLQYHVFDIVDPDSTFEERNQFLLTRLLTSEHIRRVPTYPVTDMHDLDKQHDMFVSNGYEGIMLRSAVAPYSIGKRDSGLFKYKKFQDAEFEIIGVDLDKKGLGVLRYHTQAGVVFKARSLGTDAERQRQADRPELYIGKLGTVRYSNILKSGAPEFPRTILIRDYE